MSSKRTNNIINEILIHVTLKLSNKYDIPREKLWDDIKDINETLICKHIFPKGKKKGKKCGVLLCVHHVKKKEDKDEKKEDKDEKKEDKDEILKNKEQQKIIFDINKMSEDERIATAIDLSMMIENVNKVREMNGNLLL